MLRIGDVDADCRLSRQGAGTYSLACDRSIQNDVSREILVLRFLLIAAVATFLVDAPAQARVAPFPASFHVQTIQTNGTSLYVRVGGQGPAVVLLHGFADTGDMWALLAAELATNHTVIVPDLRGMGLSAPVDTGYTKKN